MPRRHPHDPAVDDEIVAVSRSVLPLALSLCGSRSEAEDVLADAVGRCLDRWRAGRLEHPRAYLRTAVVNEVRQRHRRRSRLTFVPLRRDDEAVEQAGDGRVAERVEASVTVLTALRELPARQRLAVALRYLEDLSFEAVADMMGVTVGTAKSTVSRGVARLAEHLGVPEHEEVHDA